MSADAARIDVQTLYDLAKDQIGQHNAVMDAELRSDYADVINLSEVDANPPVEATATSQTGDQMDYFGHSQQVTL